MSASAYSVRYSISPGVALVNGEPNPLISFGGTTGYFVIGTTEPTNTDTILLVVTNLYSTVGGTINPPTEELMAVTPPAPYTGVTLQNNPVINTNATNPARTLYVPFSGLTFNNILATSQGKTLMDVNGLTQGGVYFINSNTISYFPPDISGVSQVITTCKITITEIAGPATEAMPFASPACFIEGTKLFAHVHDKDIYLNIEDLRSGDLINTYLHGQKPIKFIGKGHMTNKPAIWNHCVKRLPKSGEMTDDLLVTGAHSILEDDLSAEETEGMIVIYGTADRKIDDKKLVLSWVSNKFEAVDDNNEYTYYHLVLEHDDDENKRYGIWANGVLTESQSEKHFLEKPYELL